MSWRARAAGLALKTCPRAIFLHAVTNREKKKETLEMIFQSALRLSRKWMAPDEFRRWLMVEMRALGIREAPGTPAVVPEEWREYADFGHHLLFAAPRWTSDD